MIPFPTLFKSFLDILSMIDYFHDAFKYHSHKTHRDKQRENTYHMITSYNAENIPSIYAASRLNSYLGSLGENNQASLS